MADSLEERWLRLTSEEGDPRETLLRTTDWDGKPKIESWPESMYELDGGKVISFLRSEIKRAKEEALEKVRNQFVKRAIEGGKDREEVRGAMLYAKTLADLEALKAKLKGGSRQFVATHNGKEKR